MHKKKTSLIHSDSTWWWQPSWFLPLWIQTPCYLLSDSLKNTLTPLWLWLQLIQSDSNSFILTQLDDSSHLEFCQLEFDHLGFNHLSFPCQTHSHLPRLVPNICTKELHWFILTQLDDGSHLEFYHLSFSHLSFSSQTHSHFPRLVPTIYTKKTSLIHSDSTWWWQPSWILPLWIQTPCYLLSDSLKNTLSPLWLWLKLIQSDSNSFIFTQLDDGSHLEFCQLEFAILDSAILVFPLKLTHTCQDWFPPFAQKNFTHSFSLNLMMAVILNSAILVSAILVFPLTPPKISSHYLHKKTSLIHSDSTWWWQPYCILPWLIQTPCFLLWDSLKNTLSPLWLWLKLIQSDSNSFILT